MIARFLDTLLDRPFWVLVPIVLVAFAALQETVDLSTGRVNVEIDSSIENLLPAEGSALLDYEKVRKNFIGDDFLVVALITDDLFTQANLSALKKLTGRLEKIPGVDKVDSLANATYVRVDDSFTEIGPFLETMPASEEAARSLREDALSNPMYLGNLVSADGSGAILAVHFDPSLDNLTLGDKIDAVAAATAQEAADFRHFVTGPIVARIETGRILFSDIRVVFPLAVIATLIVSMIGLRSISGVLLPLISNAIALLITVAIFIRTGHALNFVTIIMPPVIFVVGFAYAVHIVSDFERTLMNGYEKIAAINHALREVFVPLTLTAFTTAIGFISLTTSTIETIQVFGLFCALGTFLSWLLALFFVPIGLRFLPAKERASEGKSYLLNMAPRVSKFSLENRKLILFTSFLVGVISLIAANRIDVGTDYLRNFPRDSEVRHHFTEVGERFAGAVPLQVLIESDVPNVFKNPEDLRTLDRLQNWLIAQPEIGGAVSFVDYMRMLHLTFVPTIDPLQAIPNSFNLSDQLLSLGASDDVERFVDARYKTTLIHVRSSATGSQELGDLVERIERRLGELPEHLRGKVTGSSVLLAQTMDAITRGQVFSLSGALIVIYIILSILFGSLRVGAIALIPNLLPMAAFFGILGLTGITLNLATSLVATVALGIAVDDSIHYFSRFNTESRRLANERLGVEKAITSVIRPVTFTTAALCAGFLALLVSDLRNQVEFGVLAALTLFLAWLVDMTLSPALSSGLRFVTLWEVLAIDLGDEPHKKIPLFNGLTHRQARIAALFGDIKPYKPGERILSFDQKGDEICILIEGLVVAKVTRPDGDRVLRTIHPGEVFGEVALFTGKRTANVDAETDVRVLWLNRECLDRIQGRYPKIAARLFWNLTGTVSERLADITQRV